MKKTAKRTREGQEGTRGFALAALMDARTTLHDAVIHAGLAVLGGLLEDDRAKLCGPRYGREAERRAMRAGSAEGELPLGGRRVSIRRPRA